MRWDVLIELTVAHDYYAPNMPPVTLRSDDERAFDKNGFLLRQQGNKGFVLAEESAAALPALPKQIILDLYVLSVDVITVTDGGNWTHIPQIDLPVGTDSAELDHALSTKDMSEQSPGDWCLARLVLDVLPGVHRKINVSFKAISSHWTYHVIGPGNDDVMIDDAEGLVSFDALGVTNLPDGTPASVLRSSDAMPARARPGQRFSLSKPGPFGPRTLIPVLPAPQPLFATVPTPDGAGALIQSDIYVSIS